MRVVEMGSIAEKEIECTECKTILAYTAVDVKTASPMTYEYIECPMCGEKIVLPFAEEVE